MNLIRSVVRRARGDQLAALAAELAQIKELVMAINHKVAIIEDTLMELNHDVRAGAERSLPLFIGHAEQLRTDAETAIAASQVIERQLSLLEGQLARLTSAADARADG